MILLHLEAPDGADANLLDESQPGADYSTSKTAPSYSQSARQACVRAFSSSSKIDHRRRQLAVLSLLAVSLCSMLFITIPNYAAPSVTIGKVMEYESGRGISRQSSLRRSAVHLATQFSNQPVAKSNFTLVLPSYPIFPKPQPVLKPFPEKFDATPKTILFWTKLFGVNDWRLGGFGQEPFKTLKCKVFNCKITDDRNYLNESDAVLIHFRDDFTYNDRPIPDLRKDNQLWTFVLWETPDHTYDWIWQNSHNLPRALKDFPDFFNWTMTYRLDSDVRFNYGEHIPLPEPDFSRIGFDRLEGKSKTAVWMTSHCDTASHRESLVKALMKYIDVDTIGGCDGMPGLTNGICARPTHYSGSKDECLAHLSSTYKFYFSFENSLCRDYVTEKFYRAAQLNLIPVVLNGADMSLFAPPHSYIDAQRFSSPAELAEYLAKVGSDPVLYNSYFWWKPYYDVVHHWDKASFVDHFCDLCAKVNYASAYHKPGSYADIDRWWTTDGQCYEGKSF